MAANVDQIDRIDEVLESKDIVDDGIDLHAQVHPRLVHEQVAGWHEQMLAPVVVHRILRVDVERMMNHTAACRAPLEAPSAARAWCDDQRADSKAENYLDVIDVDGYDGAKGRRRILRVDFEKRHRDPKRHVDFCWNLRSTAWFNAEHNIRRHDYDSDSDDIDTSSDEEDDGRGFLLQKQDALRASFMHHETDALIAELTVLEDEAGAGAETRVLS